MLAIRIDDERRQDLIGRLRAFFQEEFDEEISDFRASQLLDFLVATLGPQVYNQAVQDARAFMQRKLEDLEGDVYEAAGD